jgi:hypothetical protein
MDTAVSAPPPAQGVTRACDHCHGPFQPRKAWQKFCGIPCRRAFHKATGGGDLAKRVAALEAEVREIRRLLEPAR